MYFFFLWHLKAYPEGNGFKILNFESSKENVFILVSETSTLSEVAMNFEKNLLFRRTLPSLLQSSRVGIGFWRATRFFYEIIWATNQTTSTQAKLEQTEKAILLFLVITGRFLQKSEQEKPDFSRIIWLFVGWSSHGSKNLVQMLYLTLKTPALTSWDP